MKITKLERVPKDKIGRTVDNGVKSEDHEDSTAAYLNQFGFDIERVVPSQTPQSNNPDYFMDGSLWETKSPTTDNENTLKNRFRKATKQSGHGKIIIDLRRVKKNYETAERLVVQFFENNGRLRRMILIRKNGEVFDYRK